MSIHHIYISQSIIYSMLGLCVILKNFLFYLIIKIQLKFYTWIKINAANIIFNIIHRNI